MALARIQSSSAVVVSRFLQLTTGGGLRSAPASTIRHRSGPSAASTRPDQWDLYAALCVQRTPLIGPELNWLERRLKEYLTKVEVIESLYSDHEMRHFEDLRRAERLASGVNVEEKDLEEAAKQTAQDFEEASMAELKQFTPASRATKADLTNNIRSIDRSVDKHLYLITKQSLGSAQHWLLPQDKFNPTSDASLRATAERVLGSLFPNLDSLSIKFLGNCPVGFYSYHYPKSVQKDNKLGARIFFYKANVDQNSQVAVTGAGFGERVLAPTGAADFSWATRAEMAKQLHAKYWKALGTTIYPDELLDLEAMMQEKKRKITRLSNRLQKLESKYFATQPPASAASAAAASASS